MLRAICYLLVLTISFSSCAQPKSATGSSIIKNGYAYSLVTHKGIIAVDDNGVPLTSGIDTSHIIYIETPAKSRPVLQTATIGNKTYRTTCIVVKEKSVQVGISKLNGRAITIKAAPGNIFWRVQLQSAVTANKNKASSSEEASGQEVILEGNANNKKFIYRIPSQTALQSIHGV